MYLRSVLGGLGLTLLAAGCISFGGREPPPPPPAPQPAPPADAGTCDARKAGWAVGQRATSVMVERVRLASGATSARVVKPGQAVTMEFSPDRLTIRVNKRNNIVNLNCG
jgi:hypothetical protein